MALYGQIKEFNSNDETIHDYLDRLSFYLEANNVTIEAKKRAVLLTVIGPQQFRLLKDLCAPASLTTKSFNELSKLLTDHHAPTPSKFLCRARFDSRTRQPNESISEYVAALRHLSRFCEFGDTLSDRLCEKFVTGVNSPDIQRKLLLESDLKLEKAIQLAMSFQQSSDAARSLAPSEIHAVNSRLVNKHQPHQSIPTYAKQPARSNPRSKSSNNYQKCHRCKGPHASHRCKFKLATCYKCGKQGHIAKACFAKSSSVAKSSQSRQYRNQKQHYVNSHQDYLTQPMNHSTCENAQIDLQPDFNLFSVKSISHAPINVQVNINGKSISFQLDTGASLTVITKKDFDAVTGGSVSLQPCHKCLTTYTGDNVPVIGECMVHVSYNGQSVKLPLLVVEGNGPPLLGRNWLVDLKLDWGSIFSVNKARESSFSFASIDKVVSENECVFGSSGLLNDRTVKISIKDTNPRYCKARVPPYAMRDKIENELSRLESNGIIKKVDYSDWATPIVPVLKKDGSIRICGDYKTTLNKQIELNRYPIPNIEEISLNLAGGDKFTELDFSHAYTQLELHPDSKVYTTINTHKGLYQYERLCFGISSSPGIFQAVMDSIFKDIPNVCVYFDNVYITGKNDTEHLKTLDKVLKIVGEKGLKINKDKCQFMLTEISFLGYILSKQGIRPQPEKTKAIKEAPKPENTQQLRAFLGLINYYAKFIGNLSGKLSPLYKLLQKNATWHWGKQQEAAFNTAKEALSADTLLTHYDPGKRLILTCDASPDGVGAVLSHMDEKGDRPIAFASRSLNQAEKNYSQLDREGLGIIFGVKKFHKFLFGRKFTIFTDHKPLLGLFGENKTLPEHASPRIQRWAITLTAYNYELKYKPGSENSADSLSRLPLKNQSLSYVPEDVFVLFTIMDNSNINVNDIKRETQKDECLIKVYEYCKNGWPEESVNDDLRPYKIRN